MDKFAILVVDDDERLLERAKRLEATMPGLEVHTARDVVEAQNAITTTFFHVAFVDLRLSSQPARVSEGALVLRELRERRPACRRYLLTQYLTENRAEVVGLLDPRSQLVESVVDKANLQVTLPRIVEELTHAWLEQPVSIENMASLFAAVVKKCGKVSVATAPNDPVEIGSEEIAYVVSRLLGQGRRRLLDDSSGRHTFAPGDRDEVRSIDLDVQVKGRSRSVVVTGRPISGVGHSGVYCAIKIGLRDEAIEERERYERYARLGLAAERRVELLSSAMGDAIGGLCYAFAGTSPESVTDLETLLDSRSERAPGVLATLFGPGSRDWRSSELVESGQELAAFFNSAYGLEADPVIQGVHAWVGKKVDRWGCAYIDGCLKANGATIPLPSDSDFAIAALRDEYRSCVVHGDLNAANVMVADDGRVMLIDFRHTARGPRTLDAAALQVSIRLSDGEHRKDGADAISAFDIEERLLRSGFDESFAQQRDGVESLPYWARMSWLLTDMVGQGLDDFSIDEYIATCLLYAVRVLRVTQVRELARLRLLMWASALTATLRERNLPSSRERE